MSTKICPSCGERRPAAEVFCANDGWDLTGVPLAIDGRQASLPASASAAAEQRCPNGHPVRVGDLFCAVCDVEIEPTSPGSPAPGMPTPPGFAEEEQPAYDAGPPSSAAPTQVPPEPEAPPLPRIGAWSLVARVGQVSRSAEAWKVRRGDDAGEPDALLVLHPAGARLDPAVVAPTTSLAPQFTATIETGQHQGRLFEVFAVSGLRPLSELVAEGLTTEQLRKLVVGAAGILADLARLGVRHRDVCPESILVDGPALERIAFCRLGAARLSINELETAPPPELTRYAAPELLAGAVASASDWWSLGIVVLQIVTRGSCFEGIDDQVFLMQVVAGGVEIPDAVAIELKQLLQGLLAKDRSERWQGPEVEAWLAGQPVELPKSSTAARGGEAADTAAPLTLSGRPYRRVSAYALAAARSESWTEARDQLVHGRLLAWLEGFSSGERLRASIRTVVRRDDLDDDAKLGVALKHLNEDLPLVRAGEIVTPGWLLENLTEGYALVTGPAPDLLPKQSAEGWLIRLKQRAIEVRRRLAALEIEVDEPSLRLNLLSTSHKQLGEVWNGQRRMLPDTEHRGIASLLERATLRD